MRLTMERNVFRRETLKTKSIRWMINTLQRILFGARFTSSWTNTNCSTTDQTFKSGRELQLSSVETILVPCQIGQFLICDHLMGHSIQIDFHKWHCQTSRAQQLWQEFPKIDVRHRPQETSDGETNDSGFDQKMCTGSVWSGLCSEWKTKLGLEFAHRSDRCQTRCTKAGGDVSGDD